MLTSGTAPQDVKLEDGTELKLEPASAVRIDLTRSERRAELRRGAAQLTVAREGRPFILQVGASRTEVSGGQYQLTLSKGQGAIHPIGPASADMSASGLPDGQVATIDRESAATLNFNATSLADVAAAANHAGGSPVLEIDRRVAGRTVTGLFKAGDSAALGRALAAALDLELVSVRPGTIRLEPREK
jgi:transmembrane sensor